MDGKDESRRSSTRYKNEKIKSRNLSEKKRRDQFNILINELCSMVTSSNRKMDKSSVLRSTIAFLKNHSEVSVQSPSVKVQETWKPSFLSNEEFTHLMLEALDGFIIVFSCNGQILYTSESTAALLGYLPSRIYSSVFDIIHEMDKSSLYKLISSPPSSSSNPLSKDSFMSLSLHMKRGPFNSEGNSSYELVQLLGTFYHWPSTFESSTPAAAFDNDSNSCSSLGSIPPAGLELRSCFVAVGRLQTPHLLRVVNLSDETKNEFTSRHSLEWKFLFLDHRAPPIIGYLPFEVLGTSGYDYCHVDDLDNIAAAHEMLMNTGEGTSCFYRFLTKGQQWIWLQTRYYISYHQWNSKPEFIVCTHTVVSTEKVLKNLQDVPKKRSTRPSTSSMTHNNSSPTSLSPSPSVTSVGSLSSDRSELQCSAKATSNAHIGSAVLFPSPEASKDKVIRPHTPRRPPTMVNNFAEPHPHLTLTNPPRRSSALTIITNADPMIASSSRSTHNLQSCVSPNPDLSPPVLMPADTHPSQFQVDTSPPDVNPIQMDADFLRRRHNLLQQQIQSQQDELRRISEQLLLAEFVNHNPALVPNSPYQPHNMTGIEGFSYPSRVPSANSVADTVVMASAENFQRPTHSISEAFRSYMQLDQGAMSTVQSEDISFLSSEQSRDLIAQGYSMNHPMPPNT